MIVSPKLYTCRITPVQVEHNQPSGPRSQCLNV